MSLRRAAVAVILALVAGAWLPARADLGGFHIASFHADLEVQEDAQLLVTERIEVQFHEPRHGIYRTIPVRYTDPKGYAYTLGLRLLDVTDENGKEYRTKVSSSGRYTKIRIGSPKFQVQGRQIYVIRYRAERALVHFPEHDELYWNVTGHEWNVRIDHTSATVHLPGDPGQEARAAAWTGRYGVRGQETEIERSAATTTSYQVRRALEPGEGLTLALAWPHGLVSFPGPVARTARFLVDNGILLVPLVVFALLWRLYRSRGRDPEGRAAVMVRYEPPPGVTPGELGTMMDESADLRDITATVVDLAVREYLKIHVEKKEYLLGLLDDQQITFERLRGKAESDLKEHEKQVLEGLFAGGDRVELEDLQQKFYKRIPRIKNALYDHLVQEKLFAAKPSRVRMLYGILGLPVAAVTFAVGLGWALFRGGVFPYALIPPALAAAACLVLFLAFAPAMPRRTGKGVNLRNWGKGFEEFVDRVEGDRVDADNARRVFERMLPYAMALGIAASWARKFEGIYSARTGPEWYVGHNVLNFSTMGLEKSLSSAMTKAGASMTSMPRSQGSSGFSGGGSSGGGFSGGGMGGGGGGSW